MLAVPHCRRLPATSPALRVKAAAHAAGGRVGSLTRQVLTRQFVPASLTLVCTQIYRPYMQTYMQTYMNTVHACIPTHVQTSTSLQLKRFAIRCSTGDGSQTRNVIAAEPECARCASTEGTTSFC